MSPEARETVQECVQLLRRVLSSGELPPDSAFPAAPSELEAEILALAADLAALRAFAKALAAGDLAASLPLKGPLSGSLKSLQANLRHLTWQAQQIAAGDLQQRVDFMGDFSAAFNAMSAGLEQARTALSEKEKRYRQLAENARDVIWTMNLAGRFTYVSPSIETLTGFTPVEVMAAGFAQSELAAAKQMLDGFLGQIASGAAGSILPEIEIELPCKSGAVVWTATNLSTLTDEQGRPSEILGVTRDISERRRAEAAEHEERLLAEALRDSVTALNSALGLDQVLDVILENLQKVVPAEKVDVAVLDAQRRVKFVRSSGRAAKSIFEYEDIDAFAVLPDLRKMVETREPVIACEGPSGEWVALEDREWIHSSLVAPVIIDGLLVAALSLTSEQPGVFLPEQIPHLMIFADQAAAAIQKAELYERLGVLAATDELTEVPNRRHFYAHATREFEKARLFHSTLSVLMLDIDFFKKVNDTCGHIAGDQVLRGVAKICASVLRKTDLLGRFGGEEFVFLLPGAELAAAQQVAERLRRKVELSSFETSAAPVSVTVSIGVAELQGGENILDQLLDRADGALYRAKNGGRNRVIIA